MRNEIMCFEELVNNVEFRLMRKLTKKELGLLFTNPNNFYKEIGLDENKLIVLDRVRDIVSNYYNTYKEDWTDDNLQFTENQKNIDVSAYQDLLEIANNLKSDINKIYEGGNDKKKIDIKNIDLGVLPSKDEVLGSGFAIKDQSSKEGFQFDGDGEFDFMAQLTNLFPKDFQTWAQFIDIEDINNLDLELEEDCDSLDEIIGETFDTLKNKAILNITNILLKNGTIILPTKEIVDEVVDYISKNYKDKKIKTINNRVIVYE